MALPEPTDLTITFVHWCDSVYPEENLSTEDAKAEVAMLMRQSFAEQGQYPITDPVEVERSPILVLPLRNGWEPSNEDECNAHLTKWTSKGLPIIEDPDPIPGERISDDTYRATVPSEVVQHGGAVRVKHGLGGPVTVTAFAASGETWPYLVAQELTDSEIHVEMYAGAPTIMVVRDEQPEDTDGTT